MKEPCMCGATDCRQCFPENFRKGRYILVECEDCGSEFDPGDDEDATLCDDCAERRVEEAEERSE